MPLSILYQFVNYFNIFFLVSTIIFSIPQLTSIDPSTMIVPFVLIIAIAVIREGFEDYKKAKYDKLYNNSITKKYINNELIEVKWKELHVGDVVRVYKDEVIPADLVVLNSALKNGYCYLETTNIDGESALKVKESIGLTQGGSNFNNMKLHLTVDVPNKDIYSFEGYASMDSPTKDKAFLKIDNLLLRSGKLKNVDWIDGFVVYTGKESKIMMNIQ